MKQRILLTLAIAGLAAAGYGVFAQACDKDKASTATARTSARPNSYLVSNESSCSAHKNSAAVASNESSCAAHKNSAAVASMSGDQCAKGHGASAAVAAGDCCVGKHGNASAVAVAGFGGAGHQSCTGKGMAQTADVSNHADCDACADMAACAEQL